MALGSNEAEDTLSEEKPKSRNENYANQASIKICPTETRTAVKTIINIFPQMKRLIQSKVITFIEIIFGLG